MKPPSAPFRSTMIRRPRRWRTLRLAVGVAVVAVSTPVLDPAGASAASPPIADPSSDGYLGFCDQQGNPITSGAIADRPFATTVISSAAAPAGYEHGRATLYAYQPRPQVDPSQWSGRQMTASTIFSTPAHPAVVALADDASMQDFVAAFPPQVHGLVQLRMLLTAINEPAGTQRYPSTFVEVDGATWHVVGAGTVDCHAGAGIPSVVAQFSGPGAPARGPATTVAPPQQSTPRQGASTGSAPAGAQSAPGASSASGSATPPTGDGARRVAASADTGRPRGGLGVGGIVAFAALAVVLIGGAAGFIRRSRSARST